MGRQTSMIMLDIITITVIMPRMATMALVMDMAIIMPVTITMRILQVLIITTGSQTWLIFMMVMSSMRM